MYRLYEYSGVSDAVLFFPFWLAAFPNFNLKPSDLPVCLFTLHVIITSVFGEHCSCFGDDGPLRFLDVVAMDVDVITVSVEASIEDERSVHEGAGVNKTSMFTHAHLFDVKHITPVEDLEHHGTLATEYHDLLLSYLMGQTHVGGHPVALVNHGSLDLLPDITFDVVALDGVNDALLVDSTSESEHIVVLEGTERNTGSGDSHLSQDFPFILLTIILFTVSEHLVVDESSNDVKESLDGTDRVISVGVVHASYLEKSSEELVVAVATLEVHIHGLEVASGKINCTCFDRNGARVEGDFMLHGDRPAFELTCLYLVDLSTPLVPLERV